MLIKIPLRPSTDTAPMNPHQGRRLAPATRGFFLGLININYLKYLIVFDFMC